MLGHASLGVSQLDRSLAFYDAVLGAIGAVRVWTSAGAAGYGPVGGNDQLALFLRDPGDRPLAAGAGAHLAFVAPNPDAVHQAHAAALAHGGRCAGPPGPRPHYGAHYHAAFVRDLDGHKLELVCQSSDRA